MGCFDWDEGTQAQGSITSTCPVAIDFYSLYSADLHLPKSQNGEKKKRPKVKDTRIVAIKPYSTNINAFCDFVGKFNISDINLERKKKTKFVFKRLDLSLVSIPPF